MSKELFRYFLILLFMIVFMSLASADNKSPKRIVNNEPEEKACQVIKDKILKSEDITKYVKTSIQMGLNACSIVKCSIEGGGDLSQIITGAVEAGTTPDVVSKCAIDAGAKAEIVAEILNTLAAAGLCYMLPEISDVYDHPLTPSIAPDVKPVISPSGF